MQVKKFEARTMKEALEMVKTQLGPDAIILSARDNKRSFGLLGEGSVEITAAVSEETLQKKRLAESQMREQDRDKFSKSPARSQKAFIQKVVNNATAANQAPKEITNRRYIEIDDDFQTSDVDAMGTASERIKKAAQAAWLAMNESRSEQSSDQAKAQSYSRNITNESVKKSTAVQKAAVTGDRYVMQSQNPMPNMIESKEVLVLKNEIESLKAMLAGFQSATNVSATSHNTYPGADYGLPYDLSFMFERLTLEGLTKDIAAVMLDQAQEEIPMIKMKNRSLVEGWIARHILETTKIADPGLNAKIHVFVGPSGSGKTSAMVKMASHLVVHGGKKVALFTTDTNKVGASDQMKIYAQILNVPFAVIRGTQDWQNVMRFLPNLDVVLVDTAGSSLKNEEEIGNLSKCLPPTQLRPRTHLVLSATAKDEDMIEMGRRFATANYQDVIFNCLDESSRHGSIYNFMKRFDIPIHSFGIGGRVPEDFEFASRERVLDLIMRITRRAEKEQAAI